MENTLVIAIVAASATIVAAVATAFYTISSNRRKTSAESAKLEAEEVGVEFENMLKYNKIFQELTEPIKAELEQLRKEIEAMKPFLCHRNNCPTRLSKKDETSI